MRNIIIVCDFNTKKHLRHGGFFHAEANYNSEPVKL